MTNLKNTLKNIKEIALGTLGLTALYLGATIAINAIAMPIVAGFNRIERAVGAKEYSYEAKLINKGRFRGHSTNLVYGDFVKSQGDTVRLYDNADILSGKVFSNTSFNCAEVGETYQIKSLEGTLSNKLLELNCK